MEDRTARARRVKWENRDGKTVGVLGQVRVLVRGPASEPPQLPPMSDFKFSDRGPVLRLFDGDEGLAAGKAPVEVHLTQSVRPGGRYGQFDELRGRVLAVRLPERKALDPPILYHTTLEALEVALAFMHETFGVSLD